MARRSACPALVLFASTALGGCFSPTRATGGQTDTSGDGSSSSGDDEGAADTAAGPGEGHVAFAQGGELWVMDAVEGGELRALGPELDALAPGVDGTWVRISPDGAWLLFASERFDPACAGYACLTLAPIDLATADAVRGPNGLPLYSDDGAAVGDGGGTILYSAADVHSRDVLLVRANADGFDAPVALTTDSPYAFNTMPALDSTATRVAFDCGDEPYAGPGTAICEVGVDGTGFRVVWTPAQAPAGMAPGVALHHPAYTAAGDLVFEGPWAGDQIWVLAAGAPEPVQLRSDRTNDNSPCALPDGRIASLWRDRPGGMGVHELALTSSDGAAAAVILPDRDVLDVGLSCGR